MSYLPRRGYGTYESSPGWAEALGGIAGLVGNLLAGKQQNALQQQALARQQTLDQQNAQLHALQVAGLRGGLTAQGLDQQGNALPDPYLQQRQAQTAQAQAPAGLVDAASAMDGGPAASPQQPTLPGPDNLQAHIAALVAAHMTGPAQAIRQQVVDQRQQSQDQQALIDKQIARTSAGYDMQGNPLTDDYTGTPQGQTVQTGFMKPTPADWHAPMALPDTFQAEPNYRDQGVDMLRHAQFLDDKGQHGVADKLRSQAKTYIDTQDKIDTQNRQQAAAIALAVYHQGTLANQVNNLAETHAYHGQQGQQFATGQANANSRAASHDATLSGIAEGRNAVLTRGQDIGVQRFNAGVMNRNATDIYKAWQRLSTGPRGMKPPSDDPAFATHLADFAKLTPAGRDALLNSKALPESTKGVLRKLGAPALPTMLNVPADDAGDE